MNRESKFQGKKRGRKWRRKHGELEAVRDDNGVNSMDSRALVYSNERRERQADALVMSIPTDDENHMLLKLALYRKLLASIEKLFARRGDEIAGGGEGQQLIRSTGGWTIRGHSWLPKWEQDIVIRTQTTRECMSDFMATVPAILYTLTAVVPLIELPNTKIRDGLRIANVGLLCCLAMMGWWGERFKPENRWYPRHYFCWSVVCNLSMWLAGYYPNDLQQTGLRIQVVQMHVFWCVELIDKGRLQRLKREE